MTTTTQLNRLFNLPLDIQNLIFEFSRDDTKKKEFINNFNLYYKMYKYIKSEITNNIIYIINEDNKNFILYSKNEDKRKFYLELKTNEEMTEQIDDYINENIIYIYNDISFYRKCLKNEYYNKNNFNNGIKQSIIKKINKHIRNEENNKIFNMLDLETFKHNYFMYSSYSELLNYYDITYLNIKEQDYYLMIQEE